MSVDELTRDQMVQLKQQMLQEENNENGEGTSWGELAVADGLVSDERVREHYAGTDFSPEDFT